MRILSEHNLLALVLKDEKELNPVPKGNWLYVIDVVVPSDIASNFSMNDGLQFQFALDGLRNYASELGIAIDEESGDIIFGSKRYKLTYAERTNAVEGDFMIDPTGYFPPLIDSSEAELIEFHIENVTLDYDVTMYDNWNGVISLDMDKETLDKLGLTKEEIEQDFARYMKKRLEEKDGE